jgi:hypothetical protein
MDRQELEATLSEAFGDDPAISIVARQASDLADSGHFDANFGGTVTVETVVDNLRDAPDSYTLAERWNWWLGALDLSHGGYTRFSVRQDIDTQT